MNILPVDPSIKNRNFGLDIIRCFAILEVTLAHGQGIILVNVAWLPSFWIIDGVDIFFVLSGFLIGTILIKQFNVPDFSFKSVIYFWKRRWFRTLPDYLLVLLVSFIFMYLGWCSAGWDYYKYFFFLQNIFQPHSSFFPTAWSLTVEEWAYLLLPLFLSLTYHFFKMIPKKQVILLTILFFILLPLLYRLKKSFYFSINPSDYVYETLFRKTVATRLDSIAIGVFGAWCRFYYEKYWSKYAVVFLILGILLFYFTNRHLTTGINRYGIYFDACAFSILLAFPAISKITKGPRFIVRPITFISLISYSMYLVHYQLIIEPLCSMGIDLKNETHAFLVFGLYFILLIMLSTVLYTYIERPFMKMREKLKP